MILADCIGRFFKACEAPEGRSLSFKLVSTAFIKSAVLIRLALFYPDEVVLLSAAFLTSKNITSNTVTAKQAALTVGL